MAVALGTVAMLTSVALKVSAPHMSSAMGPRTDKFAVPVLSDPATITIMSVDATVMAVACC